MEVVCDQQISWSLEQVDLSCVLLSPQGSMKITIWSLLGEDSSGTVELDVPNTTTGGEVLKMFCQKKGIELKPDYVLWKKGNVLVNACKTLSQEKIQEGDIVMFTIEDKEHEHGYFTNSWWTMMVLTLLIGLAGVVFSLYLYLGPIHLPKKFGIVIDAGSSHSHLFLFAWTSKTISSTDDVKIIHECYMPGGIAMFATHPEGLKHYFLPCLDEAEKLVVSNARSETPLILGATAGMRILREYDPEGAEMVLSSIRQIFWSNTKFNTGVDDVFIVSGTQEGIDGWTAVNYLFNSFWERKNRGTYFSALDLGGASVQVSTAVNATSKWPTYNLSIFNETYSVCSTSFLCYGIVKAHYRYDYLLVRSLGTETEVASNPCLPKGTNSTFTKRDKLEPCILSNKKESHALHKILPGRREWDHIVKYKPELKAKILADPDHYINGSFKEFQPGLKKSDVVSRKEEVLFTLEGSSDSALCKKRISALFNAKLCEKTFVFGDCLSHKRIPPYSGELVGFSSVFFRILPLLKIGSNSSLSDLEAAVTRTCSLSYDDIRSLHPDMSEALARDFCFDGMYVYLLLTQGLGVTSQKWKSILFAKEIRHQDVVWALGLMLNRTSDAPLVKIEKALDPVSFVLLLGLFGACLLTSFLFVFNICKVDRKNRSYERAASLGPEERPFITA